MDEDGGVPRRAVSAGAAAAVDEGAAAVSPACLAALSEALECTICNELLYEPTTLCCGHSFCRACLLRSLDHRRSCPLCRRGAYYLASGLGVSLVLQEVLRTLQPAEYAARARDAAQALATACDALPVFVYPEVVVPGSRMPLRFFEPRYRALIRVVIENNLGQFAHVAPDPETGELGRFGCTLALRGEPEMAADGTVHVDCEGSRPFEVLEHWTHELGFRVARLRWLPADGDEPGAAPSRAAAAAPLRVSLTRVRTHVRAVLRSLSDQRRERLLAIFGQPPMPVDGPEIEAEDAAVTAGRAGGDDLLHVAGDVDRLSLFLWWVVASFQPLFSNDEKSALLETRSLRERAKHIADVLDSASWVRSLDPTQLGVCTMQ